MSQPETATQAHTPEADTAITAAPQPTASAVKPALAAVGPTLQTTEELLAREFFGKQLPAHLKLASGINLKLSVHLHEGHENLNFTFTSTEGFGLKATEFSEAVQQIIDGIPAFGSRLKSVAGTPAIATLTHAETPKDDPNALRLVLKLNTPQLSEIAQELHGLKSAPSPQPAAEIANDNALCANGTCSHDHSKDAAKLESEKPPEAQHALDAPANENAVKAHPQPEQASTAALSLQETLPHTVVAAHAAETERLKTPLAKSLAS